MNTIALLTSTRPICRDIPRPGGGPPKRVIDVRACTTLAQRFDLVIIGSGSSDKVYDRIAVTLPAGLRQKLRMYSRGFFDKFGAPDQPPGAQFNVGWQEILKTNRVFFVTEREIVNEDFSTSFETFNWRKMEQFISDERVVFVSSRQQIQSA